MTEVTSGPVRPASPIGMAVARPTAAAQPRRSGLSLRHAASFLTLVEEGSVGGAALRLRLGQSTVSGHVKALETELAHRLVERVKGGLLVTEAGWRAYARLRPLLAGAVFALQRFRHNSGQPSRFITVGLPAGFPGTPIDAAVADLTAAWGREAPDTCFLVGTGDGAPAFQGLGAEYRTAAEAAGGITDRWLWLQPAGNGNALAGPLSWDTLRGADVLLPRLSPGLTEAIRSAAQQAGAALVPVEMEPAGLLASARHRPGFRMLLPQGLVQPAALAQLDWRVMAAGPGDPVLVVAAPGMPELAALLEQRLRAVLAAAPGVRPAMAVAPADMLSLKHCRSFLALCEERHVGRAASRLFIVQPALTMQLRQIEEKLGGALFERTGRGLVPMPAAIRLQAHLTPLLGDIDAAVAALRLPVAPAPARLRIGLIPALDDESLTADGFVRGLQQWRVRHPEVRVQVVEAFSEELVQWLRKRQIDLAVLDQRFGEALLQVEPIAEDPLAAVVDAARGVLPPGPVRLQSLSRLQLVLQSGRHGLRALLSRSLAAHGLTLEPSLEVDSMAAAIRLVRSGPYVTILPVGAICRSSARRGLAIHEIEAPRLTREICLARSRAVPARQAALALMDELRIAFAQVPLPGWCR